MTTVDRIRQDIVAEIEHHRAVKQEADCVLRCAEAQLLAHDRAVAAMNQPAEPETEPRAKRRSIRAEVYGRLTGEPQTVDQLVEAIGRPRHKAVEDALHWLRDKGNAARPPGEDRWYRPDLLLTQMPAAAAA